MKPSSPSPPRSASSWPPRPQGSRLTDLPKDEDAQSAPHSPSLEGAPSPALPAHLAHPLDLKGLFPRDLLPAESDLRAQSQVSLR